MENGFKLYQDSIKEIFDLMLDFKRKNNKTVVNILNDKITQANEEAEKMRQIIKDAKNARSDSKVRSVREKLEKQKILLMSDEHQKENEEVYQTIIMHKRSGSKNSIEESNYINSNFKQPKLEKANSNKFFSPMMRQGSENGSTKNLVKK